MESPPCLGFRFGLFVLNGEKRSASRVKVSIFIIEGRAAKVGALGEDRMPSNKVISSLIPNGYLADQKKPG